MRDRDPADVTFTCSSALWRDSPILARTVSHMRTPSTKLARLEYGFYSRLSTTRRNFPQAANFHIADNPGAIALVARRSAAWIRLR
jgi:hypothetical protein